jgi:hypothetical protein
MIPISVDPRKSGALAGSEGAQPLSLAAAAQQWRLAGRTKKKGGHGKAPQGRDGEAGDAEDFVMVMKANREDTAEISYPDKMIVDVQKLDNTEIINEFEMAGPLDQFCCIPGAVRDILEKDLHRNLCTSSEASLTSALASLKKLHAYLSSPLVNSQTPIDLFKEKKYFDVQDRILGQEVELQDSQKWAGYAFKLSVVQLVTASGLEHDAIREAQNHHELTDFDALLNQDAFMALESNKTPPEGPEF